MNSRTSTGERAPAFVLKEFQKAKAKSGYDSVTISPIAPVIHSPSTLDSGDSASERLAPSGGGGLVHHDEYKRLKADLEFRSDRPASPAPDPAYEFDQRLAANGT